MSNFLHSFDRDSFGLSDRSTLRRRFPSSASDDEPFPHLSPSHSPDTSSASGSDSDDSVLAVHSRSREDRAFSAGRGPTDSRDLRQGKIHIRPSHSLSVGHERGWEDREVRMEEGREMHSLWGERLEMRPLSGGSGREGKGKEPVTYGRVGRVRAAEAEREREKEREREREKEREGVETQRAVFSSESLDQILARAAERTGAQQLRVHPKPGAAGLARAALEKKRAEERQKRVALEQAEQKEREEREERERREREEEEKRKERKKAKKGRREEKKDVRLRALEAVRKGDLDALRSEVELHQVAVGGAEGKDGETMLHVAAGRGDLDIVKYLLEKGADPKERDSLHRTVFHIALSAGHQDVVEHLLSTFPVEGNKAIYTPLPGKSNLQLGAETSLLAAELMLKHGLASTSEIKDTLNWLQTNPTSNKAGMELLLASHLPTPPAQEAAEATSSDDKDKDKLSRKQRKLADKRAKAKARAEQLGLPSRTAVDSEPETVQVVSKKASKPKTVPAPVLPLELREKEPQVVQMTVPEEPTVTIPDPTSEPTSTEHASATDLTPHATDLTPHATSLPPIVEVEPLSPSWWQAVFRIGTSSAPPRYVSLPEEDEDLEEPAPMRAVDDSSFRALPPHQSRFAPVPFPSEPTSETDATQSPWSTQSYPHTPSPPVHAPSDSQGMPVHSWQTEVSPVGGVMTGGEKFLFGIVGGLPTPPEPQGETGPYEPFQGYYEPQLSHFEMIPPPSFEPFLVQEYHPSPTFTHIPIASPPPGLPRTTLNAFAQPFVPRFNFPVPPAPQTPQTPPEEDQTPMPHPSTPQGLKSPPYAPLSNPIFHNSTELSSPIAPPTPADSSDAFETHVPQLSTSGSAASEQLVQPATPANLVAAELIVEPKSEQVYTVRLPGSRSASQSPAPTVHPVEELPSDTQPERPVSTGKAKSKKWFKKSARGKAGTPDLAVTA